MKRDTASWAHGGGPRRQNVITHFLADRRRLAGHRRWKGPKDAPKTLQNSPVAPHATAPTTLRGRLRGDGAALGEHLLGGGPLVIVANQADLADPARVLAALPSSRRTHTLMVLRRPTLRQAVTLPLAEVNVDRPRIGGGRLIGWLRRGGTVLVFPESDISTDGELGGFHPFAAELAHRAGVPIAPAAVQGSFADGPVTVRFGGPIALDPYDTLARRAREAVASLLAEGDTSWWTELTTEGSDTNDSTTDSEPWQRIWVNSRPNGTAPVRDRIWR